MAVAVGLGTLDRVFDRVLLGLPEPARGMEPWLKSRCVLELCVSLAVPVGWDGQLEFWTSSFYDFRAISGPKGHPKEMK